MPDVLPGSCPSPKREQSSPQREIVLESTSILVTLFFPLLERVGSTGMGEGPQAGVILAIGLPRPQGVFRSSILEKTRVGPS